MKTRAAAVPVDDSVVFVGRFSARNSGGYIPLRTPQARGIREAGWPEAVHVRITTHNQVSFEFVSRIRVLTSGVAQIPVLKKYCDHVALGEDFRVEIRPLRDTATETVEQGCIDLLRFAPPGVIEHPPGTLLIRALRTELYFKRYVDARAAAWFLGFYLAEGSKGATANDVTLTQVNPYQLAEYVRVLKLFFRFADRSLSLEIKFTESDSTDAVRTFSIVPLVPSAVYPKKGEARSAGTVRIRGSEILLSLIRNWTQAVLDGSYVLEPAEARSFALGFLDGDGGVTVGTSIELDVCDERNEVISRVMRSLETGFDWTLYQEKSTRPGKFCGSIRPLKPVEIGDLACAGAFRHTMARAKLVLALEDRTARTRALWTKYGRTFIGQTAIADGFELYGLSRFGHADKTDDVYTLTDATIRSFQAYTELKTEIEAMKKHAPPDGVTRKKGERNPLIEKVVIEYEEACNRVPWKEITGRAQAKIRAQKREGAEGVHHPQEKTDQIRRILEGNKKLDIYEVHGGHGYCTQAYAEFGQVTSKTSSDGDEQIVTAKELMGRHTYDVVDLDPYGYPLRLLFGGVLNLLKPQALLFVTFPRSKLSFLLGKAQLLAFCQTENPTPDDIVNTLSRYALGLQRRVELLEVLELGTSVWRFVFKVEKMTVDEIHTQVRNIIEEKTM